MTPLDRSDGNIQPGSLVRPVGDPARIGTFKGVTLSGGREYAIVAFPNSPKQRIPVDQIEQVPDGPEEPTALLRDGRFTEPSRLRQVIAHIRLSGRLADVIYSMEATNTDFHAHQFRPVLKMLDSPTGGLLIADEVGLGKTIEAGLIWAELRARFDFRRLLVLCPKSLCGKWQAELTSKFGLDARVFSAADLLDLLRDPERCARGFVAICSLSGLRPPSGWDDEDHPSFGRRSAELARLLNDRADDEPVIDLLVIDEAHHLRNPETQANTLGRLLRPLTPHLVLLSATPIHLQNRDLFSLLNLLDPETFRHETSFTDILQANIPLVSARESVLRGDDRDVVVHKLIEATRHPLLSGSKRISALVGEVSNMEDPILSADRARLASGIEEVNTLANVVTRTRRRDVQEFRVTRQVFAPRAHMSEVERSAYDAITLEIQRHAWSMEVPPGFLLATAQRQLASSVPAAIAHWRQRATDFESEDGGDDEPLAAKEMGSLVERLAHACADLPPADILENVDSKFRSLLQVLKKVFLERQDEKIVLFSTFRATLSYLQRRITLAGIRCATIHGGTEDRDAEIMRFRDDPSIRILLSSEVGSEGIDLQFCRTVVNYDLPWNPMRIEQRIGRVDRLGQVAESITVINLLHADTIDDVIYERLYARLQICERALGGFEEVLGKVIAELTPALMFGSLNEEQVRQRLDQTTQAVANRLSDEERLEREAASLIAHGDRILNEIHAAHEQQRWIGADDLARYLGDTLSILYSGSTLREVGQHETYEIRLTPDARAAYAEWLSRQRLPAGDRIVRDGLATCLLGRPSANRSNARHMERITQTHPFVRFLAQTLERTGGPSLRPAISARIGATHILGRVQLPLGRYAVMAMLWQFNGATIQEQIAYAGISIHDNALLEDDDAEALLQIAAVSGKIWLDAPEVVDRIAVADMCEGPLLDHLLARLTLEETTKRAQQHDRTAIQLRTLEERLRRERGRQTDIIEQHRGIIDRGLARGRNSASVITMAEGKLRKLDERTRLRRQEIERSREVTVRSDQLAVALIEILP